MLSLQCDDTGCAKEYFAVGGTANVTTATLDEGAGRFEGSMSNVRFVAWTLMADEALPSGECVVMSNATFSVAWDADAGMGGGAAGGGAAGGAAAGGGRAGGTASAGGAGGGTASTGGGTSSIGGGAAGGARAGGTAGGGNLTTKKACGCSTGSETMLAQAIAGLLVLRFTRRRHR